MSTEDHPTAEATAARRPRVRRPAPRSVAAAAAPPPAARDADHGAAAAAARVMAVLPRVMDAMRLAMRAQLDGPPDSSLTVPQFRGLNYVDRHPGASVSALAAFLGVSMATASAMAERLVRAGYLRAQDSAADRRRTELRIQAAGKAVLEHMRQRTRDDLARALAGRSAGELASLIEGLGVLDAAFAGVDTV